MESNERNNILMISFFMLGSYAFGFNIHNIIHEFGHAVAVWVQGGHMTGFYFHPFNACYNFSTYVPNHILLYAGGAFIGGASTLIFPLIALKYRTPFLAPLVMACIAGFVTTSKWMIIAPFSELFTDYTSMTNLGFPSWIIFLSGIIYLIIGFGVFMFFLPLFGINPKTGLTARIVIFEIGILSYLLLDKLYVWLFKGGNAKFLFLNLVSLSIFLAVGAILSGWIQNRFSFFRKCPLQKIKINHIMIICIALIILFSVMFNVSVDPQAMN